MRRAVSLAAALLLGGCAGAVDRASDSDQRELAELTAGRTAGAPVDCIDARASLRLIGGALVAQEGGRLWVNANDRSCPGGGIDPLIITEPLTGNQLCRNDRFRAAPRGTTIPGLTCRVLAWTPYARR